VQPDAAQLGKNALREFVQVPLAQIGNNANYEIVQGMLAQLSWYHHITLLDKVKDKETRLFYIQETVQNGGSRDTMVHQIEGGLHLRKGLVY
jgi:predicted nuclease of restriction endonuclease-like (RecB) superfamily